MCSGLGFDRGRFCPLAPSLIISTGERSHYNLEEVVMAIVKIEVKFDPMKGISIDPPSSPMATGDEVEWTILDAKTYDLTITLSPLAPLDWKVAPSPCPVGEKIIKSTHVVTRKIEDPRDLPTSKSRMSDTASFTVSLQSSLLTSAVPIPQVGSLVIERGVEPGDGCLPDPCDP
jgi:hypothetical protein